jgi:hypothetical protein
MPVSLTFRTAGAWGAGIGANLTPAQVDENFYELQEWIAAFEAADADPVGIANITQSGSTLTVHLTDSTALGPFQLPAAAATIEAVVRGEATITLTADDRNTYMRLTNADGCAVIVPDDLPVHTEYHFRRCGGPVTFEAESSDGVINVPSGYAAESSISGSVMTLKCVAAAECDLFGMLAEASESASA